MHVRPLLVLFALGTAVVPLTAMAAGNSGPVPITGVVELYTSQGCSSCPPADALLKTYISRPGVLALSFNVDIWDNLGWKDTLASPQFTQRQRAYARTRGDGQVYTPQAIVNGAVHAVGSDRVGIDAALRTTAEQGRRMGVTLGVTAESGGIEILANAPDHARTTAIDATVWLVKFAPRIEVAVRRGENSGQSIAYHNVVRDFRSVGHWTGNAPGVRVGDAELTGCTPGTCAILLQQGGTGAILGAAWVPGSSGI